MRVFPYRVPPLDSAECGCFQPAAELEHLQRHNHGLYVQCALPPAASAHTPEPGHTRTPHALLTRPSLCVLHLRAMRVSPLGCPLWTRQFADRFNQPLSFDTSSVTDMRYMFRVRFRLRLLPSLPSRATHARRVRC